MGIVSWVGRLIAKIKIKPMTYSEMYLKAEITPEKKAEVRYCSTRIKAARVRYEAVAAEFGMPYWFVGIIHFMEGGGNFKTHLHNGDPLSARTKNVPAGRPKGNPPFTWAESARDAIIYMGYHKVRDWSVQNCLDLFEKYNGMGYKKRGVPSPYLWSYTQFYKSGKYIKDGKYSSKAVSKQPGVVVIMKDLGV